MTRELQIATIQFDIVWENEAKNISLLNSLIAAIPKDTDVVVLPEMFNSGFTMNPSIVARKDGGKALVWMQDKAVELKSCLVGSIATKIEEAFVNRLYWVFPDGSYQFYDKRHLFRMANEHQNYNQGQKKLIVEYKGLRFCPLICYDLRFPVWSRNVSASEGNYDVLLYVANWPAARSEAWYSLLKARAIENLAYVIGVNRVGKDGNGIAYDGKSVVFDYIGQSISRHVDSVEGVSIQQISIDALTEFRNKFPAHLDADDFKLL